MSYPKPFRTSGIALTLSAVACVLTACQSSATSHIGHYQKPVHPQLLNLSVNPSSSEIAKNNLVSALHKHFAHEHMSASSAKYAIRPFVNDDSVDAESTSVFTTALETYFYQQEQQEKKEKEAEERKEALIEEYIEEIEAEQQEKIATAKANGEEIEELDEYDIREQAEEQADDFLADNEKSSKSFGDILKSDISSKRKTKRLLQAYFKMNMEKIADDEGKSEDKAKFSIEDLLRGKNKSEFILQTLKRTPEQIEAMQAHNLQYLNINTLGHYQPKSKTYQGVLSYDLTSPTQQLSLQIPYGVDFERASVSVDPSAALPLIALMKPEELASLEEADTHTINFSLPEAFRDKVPTDVIFDAFIKGTHQAFAELDSEYYTAVDISHDDFAKQVGAKNAVKLHWGMKESGEYLGKVIKSMSQDLNAYIANHPEKYSPNDTERLNIMLKVWTSVEQDFQSKDVGGLFQLLEAIAPISANQTMYYYLSADNTLQAYQTKMSIGSELYGWTMDTVMQTKLDMVSVKKSPLYTLYDEDFGENASKPVDGNKWIAKITSKSTDENSEKYLMKRAEYARYDYPDWDEVEEEKNEAEADSENNTEAPLDESSEVTQEVEAVIDNEPTDSELSELEKIRQAYRDFEK